MREIHLNSCSSDLMTASILPAHYQEQFKLRAITLIKTLYWDSVKLKNVKLAKNWILLQALVLLKWLCVEWAKSCFYFTYSAWTNQANEAERRKQLQNMRQIHTDSQEVRLQMNHWNRRPRACLHPGTAQRRTNQEIHLQLNWRSFFCWVDWKMWLNIYRWNVSHQADPPTVEGRKQQNRSCSIKMFMKQETSN